jgi:hypothetical protein
MYISHERRLWNQFILNGQGLFPSSIIDQRASTCILLFGGID